MDTDRDPFAALPREAHPPNSLYGRVRRSLDARALLAPGRSSWRGALLPVAAAGLMLVLGVVLGRRPVTSAPDSRPAFALLLYEDSTFLPGRPEEQLVAEYRTWARQIGEVSDAALVLGEKLADEERILGPAGETSFRKGPLAGFFIVRARSYDEAVRIAQTCPHLRYGGRIAVRPIVPT